MDDSDDEDTRIEDDPEEDSGPVTKKLKSSAPVVGGVRTSKKKSAGSNAGQFLAAFVEIQAASQQRQIEHDQKMQQESAAFQQRIEQDRIKFETQLATILHSKTTNSR